MKLLAPLAVAFGMFSRIPAPAVAWDKNNMRWALCAFPLVGVVQGSLAFAWGKLSVWLFVPAFLAAVIFTLIPIWVNGGIHLDGLCDTADALASHAPRAKKLQILKDPHIGAFGVLALLCNMALVIALFTVFVPTTQSLLGLVCIYALSRALSGWAVACWPAAKPEGTAHSFHSKAGNKAGVILLVEATLLCVVLGLLLGVTGFAIVIVAALVLLYYRHMAIKHFGGVSGDLAGWFLQTVELWMLAALVAGGVLRWY